MFTVCDGLAFGDKYVRNFKENDRNKDGNSENENGTYSEF